MVGRMTLFQETKLLFRNRKIGEMERECLWGWCEQEFVIKKRRGGGKKFLWGVSMIRIWVQ